MKTNIKGIEINYKQYGNPEGKNIVLLHGWGQNIQMMEPIGNNLSNYYITILDLPGFGNSSEPSDALTIYDYKEILRKFLENLKIKNTIIMGHSFGGRIAICYAAEEKVEKLVLFGSPCVRHERKNTKEKVLKGLKKLPGMNKIGEYMKKYIGSDDYKKASPIMREILVNTVNEDLSDCAKEIKCPTLLIWGTLDNAAPIEEAKELEELLVDGALIELEGCTHYAYLEALPQVINILNNFL
jgi:pimeloyl-ACP methyl ester carboxylesterase